MSAPAAVTAQRRSVCWRCGTWIVPGAVIVPAAREGGGRPRWVHQGCAAPAATGPAPPRQVRARKARRSARCPGCRAMILTGELICSIDGGPWRHGSCAAAGQRAAAVVAARYGRPVEVLRPL